MIFLRTLWLALPVILGGLVHVALIKLDVLSGLARLPLDANLTVRGRRLLGDHKTMRGAVAMIGATAAFVALQAALVTRAGWARTLSMIDFRTVPPLAWGLVLGGGYVVGELPNSFIKRQLDVPPGGRAAGALGTVFWLCDELDSLAGVLVCMPAVWTPPVHVALLLVAVTLVVHPAVDLLMIALHLKGGNSMTRIPNLLSGLRIALTPVLLALGWSGAARAFVIVLAIALVTDIVDGRLARMLGETSEVGARLDSAGDLLLFLVVPVCGVWLRPEFVRAELGWFLVAVGAATIPVVVGFCKFGRPTSYHTHGAKLSAYLLGASIFIVFAGGPAWPFRLATAVFLVAEVEELAITSVLPAWRADVPSLRHALTLRAEER